MPQRVKDLGPSSQQALASPATPESFLAMTQTGQGVSAAAVAAGTPLSAGKELFVPGTAARGRGGRAAGAAPAPAAAELALGLPRLHLPRIGG